MAGRRTRRGRPRTRARAVVARGQYFVRYGLEMAPRSLDRILASQGLGTRKACRQQIRRGEVEVAGERVTDPKSSFEPEGLALRVRDEAFVARAKVYLALNKPPGVECSRKPSHHRGVIELLPARFDLRGVQPVGRLDQDTTGLLLLSDDGAFNHAITSPRRHVAKRYRAACADAVSPELCESLLAGVQLHGEVAPVRAQACTQVGPHEVEIEIAQGKYHQVKRMLAAAGTRCTALHRLAIGALELSDLKLELGAWGELEGEELAKIQAGGDTPAQAP